MQFTIDRDTFLSPLLKVIGVVERKQTLPVLANLLIEANESEGIRVTGTDLEVEITATAQFPVEAGGAITVTARKLVDICRNLPEGSDITVSVKDQKLTLRSGKSRFSLSTMAAEEFPKMERDKEANLISVGAGALKDLLEGTHFAMAVQDVRYYLNGLLVEGREAGLRTVATDGHRLALSDLALEDFSNTDVQVIVPRKAIQEILRILDADDEVVNLELSSNQLFVSVAGVKMTSKLIDGRFPDYERVVPVGGDKVVKCGREFLRSALTRTAILSNEKYRGVRLGLSSGELHLQAHNPEHEEAEEQLSVDYQGETMEIGFNVNYLLEALSALRSETAELTFTDAQSSVLITGEGDSDRKYVVMPMRL